MVAIRTPQLELVAGTEAQLRAELDGHDALAQALGAHVPDNWPPELYGEQGTAAARWVLDRMAEVPEERRFFQYYFLLVEEGARTLVGVGGFKGAPVDGIVELGYEVVEQYRGRGFATEATAGMLAFAFSQDDVRAVVAQTLPHLAPSIGVLQRCGFHFAGDGDGDGVIRFEIEREEWLRRQPTAGILTEKLARIDAPWTPKRIARVNETDVKLARLQGQFVWHAHPAEDEMFVVLSGRLLMQFRDRERWIGPGEFIVVPRGVEHRPVAPDEVHVMLIEPVGTLNTGTLQNERTVTEVEAI